MTVPFYIMLAVFLLYCPQESFINCRAIIPSWIIQVATCILTYRVNLETCFSKVLSVHAYHELR